MIRPLNLRPRQVKSLRNWAIELAIVVIGVLLALGLAEWVESRAQRQQDALIEEAVRRELVANIVDMGTWRGLGECHREQILHMRDLLRDNDGDWPGLQRRAVLASLTEDDRRAIPGFYAMFTGTMSFDNWDTAVSSGTIERLPAEKRAGYSAAFGVFRNYSSQMKAMQAARAEIGGLVYPGKLSSGDRLNALNQLIALDGGREYFARPRHFIEIELTDEEIARAKRDLKTSEEDLRSLDDLRPCFKGFEMPDIFVDDAPTR